MGYGADGRYGLLFLDSYNLDVTSMVVTTSYHWLPVVSENVGVDKPPLIAKGMRGTFYEGDYYQGPNMVPGDITVEAQQHSLGAFCKALFGSPITVTSGVVKTHTFKPRTSDFDTVGAGNPLAFHKYLSDGGSATIFYDLAATKMELKIANGELLTATLSVVGGKYAQYGTLVATYDTGEHFPWSVTSISIDGVAKTEALDLTIVVDEKLEAKHTLNGSVFPGRIKRTDFRTVEVSGTITFDDQVEYQTFLAQNNVIMSLHMQGTTEIQSGYYESMTVILPSMRYTELKPVADGPGEIEAPISGKGVYNTGSATGLTMILVNTYVAW